MVKKMYYHINNTYYKYPMVKTIPTYYYIYPNLHV